VQLAHLLSPAIFLVGCVAGPSEELARKPMPVFGGIDDATDGVVALIAGPPDSPTNTCSGVALSSRIIVTAAHCVAGMSEVRILVGARLDKPQQTVAVATITTYPSYRAVEADQRAGFDLAIVTAAADLRVTPIALATEPDGLSPGSAVDVVGFGRTNRLDPGSTGARMRARVTITALCERLFGAGDDTHGFCAGDSGGAALSPTTGALVGLIDFGVKPACAPPGWSIRVAPYAKWINSFIDGSGDSTCSSCPPPSVCAPLQAPPVVVEDAGEVDAAQPMSGSGSEPGGCDIAWHRRPGILPLLGLLVACWRRRRAGVSPQLR